jgi:hypothetical protein
MRGKVGSFGPKMVLVIDFTKTVPTPLAGGRGTDFKGFRDE